jgi:hypothetical protein
VGGIGRVSDRIEVELGCPPWEPAAAAELDAVFDVWDVPQSGLVRANGVRFAFSSFFDPNGAVGLWLYARVDDSTAARLQTLTGDEFHSALEGALLGEDATAAASYDYLIIAAAEVTRQDSLSALVASAIAALGAEVERHREQGDAWTAGVRAEAV